MGRRQEETRAFEEEQADYRREITAQMGQLLTRVV